MQRIQFDTDEKITRKEYLRRKKKQASKIINDRKKITLIFFCIAFVLLSLYVFSQFYVYSKANSYKYLASDDAKKQQVYNVYYVTEGYTYDPVYSLNNIYSNGFNDTSFYLNSGLTDISVDETYIYGLKENGLYRVNKSTKDMETLIEKDISKYKLNGNRIYYITQNDKKIGYLDFETNEQKTFDISDVSELLCDSDNIYVVKYKKKSKILVKYDREGNNEKSLVEDSNVSYIIQNNDMIYFVNKNDSNKIYSVKKDGSNLQKVDDICSVSDNGNIKEIDGSKYMFVRNSNLYYINTEDGNSLCSVNLETKEKNKVISSSVKLIEAIDGTIFYSEKGQMGVYLFNLDTSFMAQVTSRKLKEFAVDRYETVDTTNLKENTLMKN